MKRVVLFAALLIFAGIPRFALAQLVHWPAAEGGNDHYYEIVSVPGGITWNDASLSATNRGGHLATITSSDENTFVFNLASQSTNSWYGGYGPWLGGLQATGSSEPGGGWGWITGEPFTYQNWAPNQPNNNGGKEDRIISAVLRLSPVHGTTSPPRTPISPADLWWNIHSTRML